MTKRQLLSVVGSLCGLFSAVNAAAEEGDAILVMDASGSMWGQIDGEAKIAIAKTVLGDLLNELPADRRLGLIAYGHRRKGDCGDIEELAAVGAERAAILSAVAALNPKGKTPMTDAVKMAAEKLKYTENKATVILISDGIETCAPDPCTAAAALEAAGVDFTAHVIGFDVKEENEQAQLRCIAENTGGQFVSAANASELGEALQTTVVEAPQAAPEQNLWLRATELEGGLLIEEGLTWTVTPSAGGDAAFTEENAGKVETTVPVGEYDITVMRPSDGLKGEAKGVVIRPNANKTVTIALTFAVEATVRVEPAETGVAGSTIKVYFTGPERKGDYIALSEKESNDGSYKSYQYAAKGSPAELRLPVEPGNYELRYVLGRPIRVLARVDYVVTPASATLTAPDSVVAGGDIAVEFTGPPPASGDFITITKPEDPERSYKSYAYTRNGSPAALRAPLEAGEYEIRFVQGNTKVLARRPITVTEALATVLAPETAGAGDTIKVEFTGPPPASGDYITVTAPDAAGNKYGSYAYTKNGSPASIRMPLEAGDFEIRYVQGGKKVIARQAITVTAAEASVSAKTSAIAGETVSVEFSGPEPGSGDFITVTAPDAPPRKFNDYAYTKNGNPAKVRMPLEPGAYEIRFVQGNNKVIATQLITVIAATASLDAPETAPAGSLLSVEFTGPPPGSGDYVAIAEVGSDDLKYKAYGYTKQGSPAKIRLPKDPGNYELRFIHGNKKVLARRPITLTAPE